jgi:hypothetical protein
MNDTAQPIRVRAGAHVHAYLWIARSLLILGLTLLVFLTVDDPAIGLGAMAICTIAACASLWAAARRCSSPQLSGGDGLLLITGYMTIGIGGMSVVVAVPAAMAALLGTVAFAILGALRGDATFAPRQLAALVAFARRHRMYQ